MASGESNLTITVLGSGTSSGVPTVGCRCAVCTSTDPRDKRLRPAVHVRYRDRGVLIDTTPDFRQQALTFGIERVDAVLFTHAHADHILGLDDLRPFNYHQAGPIPIYADEHSMEIIQRVFTYVFNGVKSESSRPNLVPHIIDDQPIELFGVPFEPIPLHHGKGRSLGFRFGNAAYLTDHSDIPDASKARLEGLDVLFLDALRHKPHPTHTTVERALAHVEELRPRRAFFTHIAHELSHQETEAALPVGVRLAYDGLEITVEMPA